MVLKIFTDIKLRSEHILAAPGQELSRGARFVRFQLQLWRFCAKRLWENNVAAMSAALSFRTIFAMVPALVLALLVLKSVGVLEDGKQSLRQVLERSGFAQIKVQHAEGADSPDGAAELERMVNVAEEIESLVERVESKLSVRRIAPVGAILLIWTALTLLTAVERSLNRIFGAQRHRPLGRRLVLYWSVLTLAPLVSVAAAYGGRSAARACADLPGVSWLLAVVGWVGPVIVGILVLAAVYKLMPHTDLRYHAALGGATVAVLLWLLAKWGFAIYVTELVGTGNLYGALGLLPLFLIWLNLSWSIFLFGAEVAHTAANLNTMTLEEQAGRITLGPDDLLATAVAVAQAYVAAHGPTSVEQLATRLCLPRYAVQQLLDKLEAASLVCAVHDRSEGSYVLAKPPERIPVLGILGIESEDRTPSASRHYERDLEQIVSQTWATTRVALGTFTLADAIAAGEGRGYARH